MATSEDQPNQDDIRAREVLSEITSTAEHALGQEAIAGAEYATYLAGVVVPAMITAEAEEIIGSGSSMAPSPAEEEFLKAGRLDLARLQGLIDNGTLDNPTLTADMRKSMFEYRVANIHNGIGIPPPPPQT
jgi:hypothetical protein